jgi:hypothetical protein
VSSIAFADDPDDVPGADDQRALRAATARCRELATQIAVLQAELVDATHEVLVLGGALGGVTPAAHLAAECQLTGAEARRIVGLAERLEKLPSMRRSFGEGRLSEGTVVSLASVATPVNEEALLETAANANATQLQRIVRNYRIVRENLEEADGKLPDERLSTGIRRDGMWHISGRAHPERGAEIDAALRAMLEVDGDRLVSPGEVQALAGLVQPDQLAVGLLEHALELDENGEPVRRVVTIRPDNDRDEPIDARQRDVEPPGAMEALVRLAQSLLAGETTAAGVLPDRFLTVVHASADDDEMIDAHLQGGGLIEQPGIDELLCGSWIAAVVTKHGQPVTGTSPLRSPPPAMLSALLARDQGCRFCGSAHFLHAHHIKSVNKLGETKLSNLILLCGTCHRRLHRYGWSIKGDPNGPPGALEFYRQDGSRIPVESLRRSVDPVSPPPAPDDDAVAARESHNDQRLDRYANDVVIDHWLLPPGEA